MTVRDDPTSLAPGFHTGVTSRTFRRRAALVSAARRPRSILPGAAGDPGACRRVPRGV